MSEPQHDRASWAWLALAVVAGILASGSGANAAAAWLAPLVTLRFFRGQPTGRGVAGLFVAGVIVLAVGWRIFPFGGAAGLGVFAAVGGAMGVVPFLADRWLGGRGPGIGATLVYPVAATALEFLLGQGGELGSWGATAYAMVAQPAVLPLVSWTGLAGPAFLVAWVASAANAAWEHGAAARRSVVLCGVVVALIAIAGAAVPTTSPGDTVRVAAIGGPRWDGVPEAVRPVLFEGSPLDEVSLTVVREHNAPAIEALWRTSDRAAAGGARLVAWSEGAATMWEADEAGFIDRATRWAAERRTVLVAGVVVLPTGADRRLRNEALVFTPDRGLTSRYAKAVPTPGLERAISRRGDGRLLPVDTDFGRIATVICYDLDFPGLLAQAGAAEVDLVVAPAGDWPEVATVHAAMARFRAAEQGVAVLRPASAGLSSAVGPRGEVLAARTTDGSGDSLVFAELPLSGRRATPYSRLGDAFGWAAVASCGGLMLAGLWRSARSMAARRA